MSKLSAEDLRNVLSPGGASLELQHESWRIFQVMSEFVESFDKLAGIHPAVSFFGSARTKSNHPHYRFARKTAKLISESGFSIISGGGPGIMEAVNRGAQEGGSPSIGLNIILPGQSEPPNAYQDISVDFHHFFIRKLMFMQYASAYIVMPGGLGTLDELLECLTLIQTKKAQRIPIILAGSEFWGGLVDWLRDILLTNGTISEKDLRLFQVLDEPEEIRTAVLDFYEEHGFPQMSDQQKFSL